MKRSLILTIALAVALSTTVMAKDHDHDNDKHKGNPHGQQARDNDRDDRANWHARDGWEYRTYDRDRRPPGWSQGKKAGWGNCNLPPGQAKKYGCNVYRYQGRDHYWYRDNVGRIIVRRPIITAHAGVEIR